MRTHFARKGTAMAAGVAAVALAVAGCSGSSSGGTSGNGGGGNGGGGGSSSTSSGGGPTGGSGTLIWGESTEFPSNLMPLIAAGNATSTANLEVRLLNGPFQVAPNIRFQPDPTQVVGTPTSKLVNGQQVVTYQINPKAVWDDGKPVTGNDYKFTWEAEKSADPKQGGCASLLSVTGYDQIQSVDVSGPGDKTVKVTYMKGKSFPDWQALFSPLLSQHVMDQGDPKKNCDYITKGWPIKNGLPAGVTNGPWVLGAINAQTKTFTLNPNPKWWGSGPKLAHLIDTYIGSDSDTNVKSLQNQETNVIYPQPQLDLVANLKQLPDVTTEINFGVSFEHLDFNTKYGALGDKRVREAIAYAIDRPALVNATVGQFSDKASVLGNRLLMANQPGYQDHSGPYAHQNVAKAKALLQQAGATMGSDGYYVLNGKPLAFVIETTQDNPLRDTTVQTIASQLKPVGIKITEDADPHIFDGADQPHSLEAEGFQIALFAWVGSPSISSNASIYLEKNKGGGQNYSQGGTPQIDTALNKMSSSFNTSDEIKYANQADSLLWQQMYTLPLYQKPTLLAFSNSIHGLADNPTQVGPLWNSETFSMG